MKKIININLSGRLIPIEDSAYEILRQYLDSLKKYFSKEEGGDEIVADIEARIAELFQDKLKKGAHCITDDDVTSMKAAMGTPEQFDEEAPKEQAQQQQTQNEYYSRPRKRLYRDPDNKVLSGVCSGLGAYFNVDPVIFRIIFALLAIGGFGTGILVYFILWIATPSADTAAEKLEMRGERVDLNNIRATIQEELQNVKGHVKSVGDDIKNFSQGRGKQVGNDIERFFVNLASGLGKALVFVTKGFFYFLAVVLLFCLVVAAISIAISSAALMPLQHLIFSAEQHTFLLWPAVGLLVGIPLIALVIFLVRKLTGSKQTSRFVGPTLAFLWLLGFLFAGMVAVSLVKDFRRSSTNKQTFAITQPAKGKLILKRLPGIQSDDEDDFKFMDEHFYVDEDTVVIGDIRIKIEKSTTDSFGVDVVRFSKGRTESQAAQLASDIQFKLNQQDSVLYIPSGFSLPLNDKYRGQHITLIVKVPNGKNLEIDHDVYRYFSFRRYNADDNWDFNDDDETPANLKMTPDGLHDENRKERPVEQKSQDKDSLENNYRYHDKGEEKDNKKDTGSIKERATAAVASLGQIKDGISYIAYGILNLHKS
ncbi:PspC domain-containing protein [Chitinophaga vietnamensis]|uniref:PspC domain-containing protein n=1 Tax=Chitinophaga vietnamensis TaxID=2593957 RepID=UPI001177F3D7|nr:PspC domain-containing protein [Chitinophaga vietnamensis]